MLPLLKCDYGWMIEDRAMELIDISSAKVYECLLAILSVIIFENIF
jgi:hypothetical protein